MKKIKPQKFPLTLTIYKPKKSRITIYSDIIPIIIHTSVISKNKKVRWTFNYLIIQKDMVYVIEHETIEINPVTHPTKQPNKKISRTRFYETEYDKNTKSIKLIPIKSKSRINKIIYYLKNFFII